jgi:jumonji domain-containing protein 7
VQIIGQKHFVLLPPVEVACVNEQFLPAATYEPVRGSSGLEMEVKLDEPPATVPFAIWDPDSPETRSTPFSRLSKPLRITLFPGDMLYLPSLWYHKVSQSCSDEGICCAVNYWYVVVKLQFPILIVVGMTWNLMVHFIRYATSHGVLVY